VSVFRLISISLLLFICATKVGAESITLPRTSGEISIDGVLDEAAWKEATQVDLMYETNPGENLPARVQTTAYIMEDGVNLYIGYDASDPDPSAIRAYLRDRDSAFADDLVGISIDTYNDGRRAFEFRANALGVQMDLTYNEVGGGGGGFGKNANDSWDAIWDSSGKINETGYAVEIKIPLNQLRFPATDGLKTWGVNLYRAYPRGKRFEFSNIPEDRQNSCYVCQFGELKGLEGAEPGRDLEVVPTVTALQSSTTDDPGFIPLASEDAKVEAGLNVRWGITPDLTANLAVNPDFSQIEADAAQLDVNNRFALFFPEKRPFFLEGADYFETPINAVFTRTIADPEVGLKLTGKRGNHTFGLITAQDEITNLVFPEAFGSDSTSLEQSNTVVVGRYSRGFSNTSSIGAIATIRDGDGYRNIVSGLDGQWRINDQHKLTVQHLESQTNYPDATALEFGQPVDEFSGSASLARYEFSSRDWMWNLGYSRSGEGYRSDLGFQKRTGVVRQSANLGRIWHGEKDSWWTRIRVNGLYDILHEDNGDFAERDLQFRFGIGGPMQSWTRLTVRTGAEQDDGVVFDKQRIALYTEFKPRGGLALKFVIEDGDQIDFENNRLADQLYFQSGIEWNVSRNLLLDVDGTFANMDTKQGEKVFKASIIDARATWQFNVRSYIRLTWQRSSTSRNPDVYLEDVDAESRNDGRELLYSYKMNPQTVFFLGYSDQYLDDDNLDGLTVSDRNIFMKIGYVWNL
jgi:hypothetical protein